MNYFNLLPLLKVFIIPILILLSAWNTVFSLASAIFLFLLVVILDLLNHRLMKKAKYNSSPKIKSFLEPFADKLMIMVILLFYSWEGLFFFSLVFLFFLRDVFSAMIRWRAAQEEIVIKSEKYARLTIFFQYGIILSILFLHLSLKDVFLFLFELSLASVVIFTVLSLVLAIVSLRDCFLVYIREKWQKKISGKLTETNRILILANKKSRGYNDHYRRHLLKVFAKRREAKIVYLSEGKNIFSEAEKEMKKYNYVFLAGGDGTFESALNNAIFQKKVLGFFPFGGGNALYSYFYRGKRYEYLRSRFPFREVNLDVLEIKWENGRRETIFLSLGMDSEVIRLSQQRSPNGLNDYLKGGLKALFKTKNNYSYHLEIDGKELSLKKCANITLAKIPYMGFGVRNMVGYISPDDQQVYGLAIVNSHSPLFNKALRIWGLLLTMFNFPKAPLFPFKGRKIKVSSSRPFPLQAGGDFLGYTKWITIEVKRKQKVLMV